MIRKAYTIFVIIFAWSCYVSYLQQYPEHWWEYFTLDHHDEAIEAEIKTFYKIGLYSFVGFLIIITLIYLTFYFL